MPTTTLAKTSQLISDVFYQTYTNDESFLGLVHFRFMISSFYSTLLLNEYQESKKENFGETGMIFPSFSSGLIRDTEKLEVKEDGQFSYIEIPPVVSFPHDNWGFGVRSISCEENTVNKMFQRASQSYKNKFDGIPSNGIIWWWPKASRVYMYSGSKLPSEIVASIIPVMDYEDLDFVIQDTLQTQIINGVLDFFKQKTQGNVIDTTNDSNPNKALQTEINNVFRNIKTNTV